MERRNPSRIAIVPRIAKSPPGVKNSKKISVIPINPEDKISKSIRSKLSYFIDFDNRKKMSFQQFKKICLSF